MRSSTLAASFAFGAQLAAASPLAQSSIPTLHGVSADAIMELRNATDFSAIDATKWATFLGQPHDTLAAWEPQTKHRMFSVLHTVLDFGTGLEKRGLTAAQAKAQIIAKENAFKTEVATDEVQDKDEESCLTSSICLLCIGAAASFGIGKIAACGTAALSAEALTAPETAGASTLAVVTGFIECASIPLAGFLTATGVCIEAVKHIGR